MNALAKMSNIEVWLPEGEAASIDPAPAWFSDLQAQARSRYQSSGLPAIKDEQWRYTKLKDLLGSHLKFAAKGAMVSALAPTESLRLVFVDGFYNSELSTLDNMPDGIMVTNLASALVKNEEVLEPLLSSALPDEQHGFTTLNSAYATDGVVVIADKNATSKDPIECVFIHTKESVSHARNVILASANSQCVIIEKHLSEHGDVYLNNSITEIFAEDGAKIDHYKVQKESDAAFHMGGVFAKQARDSEVKTHSLTFSGKLIRNDTNGRLDGQGAHLEMNGLVLGRDTQHVDNHTEVNHAVPNCTSDELYKSVLDDKARSVFRGRIIVAQDAQQTNADQQNNNLLLSKNAEADTKPQLEIYADDVKCSHGATVGQIDPKSLFYLQSRGINKADAMALLTFAFANEVVERVQIDSIREELTSLIAGDLVGEAL